MSKKIEQFSRLLNHRTTIAGQVFTIPTSNDHTDQTWANTDLYIGEIGINLTDDKMFMRTNNGIVEVGGTSSGGGGLTSSLFDWVNPDIKIGSTYSVDSFTVRTGYYTDLGNSTLRWKDLYLGGSSTGFSNINVNGGVILTQASSNGILSSGLESNDNTPIQIYSTSSNVNKDRPIHINSKNSFIGTGNQKVSIASNNIIDNSSSDMFISGRDVTINTGVTSSVHLGNGYNKINYTSNEVVVGNLAVRGISDDGSGQYAVSDWKTSQSKVRTTNALSTNLASIPFTYDGVVMQVKCYVIGVSIVDATKVYSAEIIGTFYGGGSYVNSVVGTPITNAVSSWVGIQPDCEMVSDSTGVKIKVTGLSSTSIQWLCTHSHHRLINLIP